MESIVIEHVDLPAPDVTRAPQQRETELRHALQQTRSSTAVRRDEVTERSGCVARQEPSSSRSSKNAAKLSDLQWESQ